MAELPYFPHMQGSFVPPQIGNALNSKAALRMQMKHQRKVLNPASRSTANWQCANRIRALIAIHKPSIVGLYMPLLGEIDLRRLADDLKPGNSLDIELALPRVAMKGHPLVFNKWWPSAKLDHDKHGIPAAKGQEVHPTMIIMPCLAFDRRGFRVGSGGGYYDMTLKNLRMPAITIAVAHSFQETEAIENEYHDQPADYVVTEKETIIARRTRF